MRLPKVSDHSRRAVHHPRVSPCPAVVELETRFTRPRRRQGSDSAPIKERSRTPKRRRQGLAASQSKLRLRAMTDLDECEKTLVQIGHE